MFRLIAFGLTAGLLLCPISAIAVDSDGAEGRCCTIRTRRELGRFPALVHDTTA